MFSKLFIVMTAVVVAVNAQSGTWTSAPVVPTFDTCTATCLMEAAMQDGCGTFTNVTCVCTNQQFIADAGNCIALDCGANDTMAAQVVQSMVCSAAGLTATGASATPSALPFGQGTDTSDDSGTAPATGAAAPTTTGGSSVASVSTAAGASGSAGGSTTATGTAAAESGSASSAAGSLVANGGVAAIAALVAGLLAL